MSIRDHLLAERAKILRELEAVETLLIRQGWTPAKVEERPPAPIEYSKEFRTMVAALPDPQFTISDFRNYLLKNHPPESINENSMRTPIKTELEAGSIVIVKPGVGRRAAIYGRAMKFQTLYPHLPVEFDMIDY